MKLQLVGCSHQTAPVELRQQLAFAAEDLPEAIEGLQIRFPKTEAVVLSTCNRVEVYTAIRMNRHHTRMWFNFWQTFIT